MCTNSKIYVHNYYYYVRIAKTKLFLSFSSFLLFLVEISTTTPKKMISYFPPLLLFFVIGNVDGQKCTIVPEIGMEVDDVGPFKIGESKEFRCKHHYYLFGSGNGFCSALGIWQFNGRCLNDTAIGIAPSKSIDSSIAFSFFIVLAFVLGFVLLGAFCHIFSC